MKINGKTHYPWQAVDHEEEVLDAVATKKRDHKAALKVLRKLLKRYGSAGEIVTDRLTSYRCGILESNTSKVPDDTSITDLRILTCHSDDGNGRC